MASGLFYPDVKALPYWWEAWRRNAEGSAGQAYPSRPLHSSQVIPLVASLTCLPA
jgi:hypothetical protein